MCRPMLHKNEPMQKTINTQKMLADSLINHMTKWCIINAWEPLKLFRSCVMNYRVSHNHRGKPSLWCYSTAVTLTPAKNTLRAMEGVSESVSQKTSPQTDWHIGYHIVTHQHWCFDKPAWPLCCTITWSQLVRSKVSANGWCSKGSSFMSGCVCVSVRVCAAVLRPYSHKDCGSFLLCGSYFDIQHHIRSGTVDF